MNKRGQSLIEHFCFLAIFIAAMVVMSAYMKRGIQGNWHSNIASVYPDIYQPGQGAGYSQVDSVNTQLPGFGKGGAPWLLDGNAWSLWR